MRKINQIYDDFKDGESLSDDEVRVLHDHMRDLHLSAIQVGPVFSLVAKEAYHVYTRLREIIIARAERKNGLS